jgi:hypothetical protein
VEQAMEALHKEAIGIAWLKFLCNESGEISEAAIKLWIKTGDLNDTKTINAFRFAEAAGGSIENFIVVQDD